MRWICLALLLAGCTTGPQFTYTDVEAIVPGRTTKADILAKFGEPTRFSRNGTETLTYEKRSYTRVQAFDVWFTNGIVERVWTHVFTIDPVFY